jgi:hypothetical protein
MVSYFGYRSTHVPLRFLLKCDPAIGPKGVLCTHLWHTLYDSLSPRLYVNLDGGVFVIVDTPICVTQLVRSSLQVVSPSFLPF